MPTPKNTAPKTARKTTARAKAVAAAEPASTKAPVGHPDYEFPKEVHNLLITAQSGHVTLSEMADTKASILMGATFVVFTLSINEITSNHATLPLMILSGFSFLATVLSVLALRPKMLKPPTAIAPNTNLVFFGSFTGIPEDEYVDRIIQVLRSEEETYRVMARDLYQNGRVLQFKKYRYLSWSYGVFLIGIVATFTAFLIELGLGVLAK